MKTFKRLAVLVVGFVGLLAGPAHAQDRIVANVPFPFVLRGETFPAGRYTVSVDNSVLTIRSFDNRSGTFALAEPADGTDPAGSRPAFVFARSEKEYRLSQIWESDGEGLALAEPRAAGRHARADAAASGAPVVVLAENVE